MANVSILYQKIQARKAALLQDRAAVGQTLEEIDNELIAVNKLVSGFGFILEEADYIETHSGVVIE